MKIQIREGGVELTGGLRAHVERRLGFALGRFHDRIGRVSVQLSRADGPDHRCKIDVTLRPRRVTVEDADGDLFAAVDHAARRLSRSVAHALDREPDPRED